MGTRSGILNMSWSSVKSIVTLLTTGQGTAGSLELVHTDGGESGSAVVLGGVLVDLVHWDSSVHDVWLDGLLVDNGLDVLMHVVVSVGSNCLAGNTSGVLSVVADGSILELAGLMGEALLVMTSVVVVDVSSLDTGSLVVVLLWENLLVVYRLDRGVVVVLVHLAVGGLSYTLLLLRSDGLAGDGWGYCLVDSGVVLAILADDLLNGVLGGLHFGWLN